MKNRIHPYLLFIMTVLVFNLTSCSHHKNEKKLELALELADDNRIELQKVLDYYQAPKDSLKLKAAKFLIVNMPYHSYLDYGKVYDDIFKEAGKVRKEKKAIFVNRIKFLKKNLIGEKRYFNIRKVNTGIARPVLRFLSKKIDSVNKKVLTRPNRVYDLQKLKAEFLIENIELAFEVYNDNLKLCNSFEDFLEYILPYRVLTEPVEKDKRKYFLKKYKWARDSLKIKSVENVVIELYHELGLSGITFDKENYPYRGIPSLSQIEATRFGNCEYLALYFVSILRSIGIPSGIDYSQRWGNSIFSGQHSWVFYKDGNQFKNFNIGESDHNLVKLYHQSNVTKIFRNTFSKPEKKDVTDLYHDVTNINIDILWDDNKKNGFDVYLGVFNPKRGWDKIVKGDIINNKVVFKKVATDLVYAAFLENEDGQHLINYPFEIDKKGNIHYLATDISSTTKGIILRKYPLVHYLGNGKKIKAMKSLNGCILQGSNNLNSKYKDIYKIKDFFSSHEIIIPLNNFTKYKFYRFYKPGINYTQIASFHLLDSTFQEIKNYKTLSSNTKWVNNQLKLLIDHNPLSYVGSLKFSLDYSFEKPTEVSAMRVQAKNDDNHINKGELYELLYWNKKWISLGSQVANDTVLYYKNIPKNALYWLKNNTKGNEECVFKLDENGNQVWVGAESN